MQAAVAVVPVQRQTGAIELVIVAAHGDGNTVSSDGRAGVVDEALRVQPQRVVVERDVVQVEPERRFVGVSRRIQGDMHLVQYAVVGRLHRHRERAGRVRIGSRRAFNVDDARIALDHHELAVVEVEDGDRMDRLERAVRLRRVFVGLELRGQPAFVVEAVDPAVFTGADLQLGDTATVHAVLNGTH